MYYSDCFGSATIEWLAQLRPNSNTEPLDRTRDGAQARGRAQPQSDNELADRYTQSAECCTVVAEWYVDPGDVCASRAAECFLRSPLLGRSPRFAPFGVEHLRVTN